MKTKFSGYKQAAFVLLLIFCCYALYDIYICLQPAMLERLGITAGDLGIATALQTIVGFAISFFAGPIYKKVKPHVCLIIMVFFLLSFVLICETTKSLFVVILMNTLYGLFVGVACQPATTIFLSSWFIRGRDQMLSLVGTFANLGLAISGFLFSAMTVKMESMRAGMICLGLFGTTAVVLGFLLRDPEYLGQKPLGYDDDSGADEKMPSESVGLSVKEIRRTPAFYVFMAAMFITGIGVMIFSYAILFVSSKGYSDSVSALTSSFSFIGACVGAILLGRLITKTSAEIYVITLFLCCILSSIMLYIWTKGDMPLYIALVCVAIGGAGNAGTNMGAAMLVPRLFGMKSFSSLMPLYQAFLTIGIGVGAFLLPTMATSSGDWASAMFLTIICMIVGFIVTLMALAMSPLKKLEKQQ